METVTFRVVNM